MSARGNSRRRLAGLLLFGKLALALALPLAIIGAGVWWYTGSVVQARAIEAQAASYANVVQAAIGDQVSLDGEGSVQVTDLDAVEGDVDRILRPGLGIGGLRIVAPDGEVLFSTRDADVDRRLRLSELDRAAFRGEPNGAALSSAGTAASVAYALPLRAPSATDEVVAVAQVEVIDDAMYALTRDARSLLLPEFLAALAATWVALVALSWWQVRTIRIESRVNREMAMSDNLTGLANRMHFHERLDEAIAAAARSDGERVGLLMLDLDGFKAINDTGGHSAGDRLLRRVSAKLVEAIRKNEIACRLGGDEFAILVPRLADREELVGMANRLHTELDLTVDFTNGQSLRTTASIGLAVYPEDASTSDELVAAADIGMYTVKANRRAKLREAGVLVGRRR